MPSRFAPFVWILFGAAYGLTLRLVFANSPKMAGLEIISIAFMCGTPIVIGAIVAYGLRDTKPTIFKMLWAPWLSVTLAMFGSAITFLEGSICIILAAPVLYVLSSLGGLVMGLVLRWTRLGKATLNTILALPLVLAMVEPAIPVSPPILEERVTVEVAAPPHRIWTEILNARNIQPNELPWNFTHWIGVPRPVEGINAFTPEGEVRHSKWERGVNFSALVTAREDDRSITWKYHFTDTSFPPGSLDDHVKIGGKYFDLYDTTFNLSPLANGKTNLEIISHYRVTTSVNFYGIPVARFIARNFMSAIVGLYKQRSERDI